MKVFSGLELEKGVDYSSIQNCVYACHFVSLSLLVSVRESSKYNLTSQKFWKLTNNGAKCCNFKLHVTGCLSIIKHYLWKTSKEPFSCALQFSFLQCCDKTFFVIQLQRLRCKIKIIACNPVHQLLNYSTISLNYGT